MVYSRPLLEHEVHHGRGLWKALADSHPLAAFASLLAQRARGLQILALAFVPPTPKSEVFTKIARKSEKYSFFRHFLIAFGLVKIPKKGLDHVFRVNFSTLF